MIPLVGLFLVCVGEELTVFTVLGVGSSRLASTKWSVALTLVVKQIFSAGASWSLLELLGASCGLPRTSWGFLAPSWVLPGASVEFPRAS